MMEKKRVEEVYFICYQQENLLFGANKRPICRVLYWICAELTMKISERRHLVTSRSSGVFATDFQ